MSSFLLNKHAVMFPASKWRGRTVYHALKCVQLKHLLAARKERSDPVNWAHKEWTAWFIQCASLCSLLMPWKWLESTAAAQCSGGKNISLLNQQKATDLVFKTSHSRTVCPSRISVTSPRTRGRMDFDMRSRWKHCCFLALWTSICVTNQEQNRPDSACFSTFQLPSLIHFSPPHRYDDCQP